MVPPATSARADDPRAIHRQLYRFVIVGLASTLFDGVTYHFALALLPVNLAKGIGYLVGTAFAIFCNARWSFGRAGDDRGAVIARCCLLYGLALLINISVNRLGLMLVGARPGGDVAAFMLAVAASTIFNFAGWRWWIFR